MPTIRGGLRTEVGYQLDGVPFTEPFFAGNASNGLYNGGLGSLQVVEGAGDATQGNVGGGVVNVVPKRGTYPASGDLDLEVGGPNYFHQFAFSYGFATPNNRISDYFSFTGQRLNPYTIATNAGSPGSNLNAGSYGAFYHPSSQISNDLSNNFVFKFGHNNGQTLSVLYENQDYDQFGNLGGISGANYYPNDPTNPFSENSESGLGVPNYQNLVGLTPYLPNNLNTSPLYDEEITSNQTRFLKFEYDNNISSTSFLQLKYYNWETLQTSSNLTGTNDNQPTNLGLGSYPVVSTVGGPRVGGDLTFTQQIGSRSTTTLDAKYEVSHPIWNEYDPNAEVYLLSLAAPQGGPSINDFEKYNAVTCPTCGYLQQFFPNGIPRIPVSGINYNGADFHQFGLGLREQYSASDKLKFDVGLRFDQQIQQYGFNPLNPTEPNNPSDVNPASLDDKYLDPHELEPRAAVGYQFGANDAVRGSYGRSVVFLTGQTAGTPAGFYNFSAFEKVPAIGNFACGSGDNPTKTVPCQNYAQQLYWLYDQNFDAPDVGGALPALFNNYDFTYTHQFKGGYAIKLTPFYKQGTNLPSFALVNSLAAGAAVFTVNNEGINKTSGIAFGFTTPERPAGFSGFLSATYQNVIGSTPPLISGEDALPINGSGSLGLGDTYRAGYVSPVDVRIGGEFKTKNGFRVNPVLEFNIGYPYSVGNTLASSCQLANGQFANLPQVNFGCNVTAIPGFQSLTGTTNSTNYYDPAYSGTSTNPNIAATRGTPATSSSGGVLSHPNLSADLTLEYKRGRNTIGVSATNLFGNVFNNSIPLINPYYQPVANGASGPLTGINTNGLVYANRGFDNVPKDAYAFTNGAYLLLPNAPTQFQVYYQLGL